MFFIADTPVKFVGLLVLFVFTTIWSAYEVYRSRTIRQIVSNVAHLVMAIVMVLMVPASLWQPFAKVVPIQATIGFFVVAVVWFHWLGVEALRGDAGQRSLAAHFFGHAAMMGAMAWHLIAMAVKMSHSGHMGHGMGTWSVAASQVGGVLWIIALVGLPLMTYLLAASVVNLVDAARPTPRGVHARQAALETVGVELTGLPAVEIADVGVAEQPTHEMAGCHYPGSGTSVAYRRLSALCGFAMNFGMFWMSTGLLTPILPFMKYLAF